MKLPSWPKAALPFLTLIATGVLLVRPGALLVNLGAGDEGLARGFQDWERAGPEGRTMFRWTRDGATVELPVSARSEALQLRVRLARFLPQPTTLTWRVNGRDALRHEVRPRGWHTETLDLGPVRGPVVLEIRSVDQADAVGAAIDWIEIRGARALLPRRRELLWLLALILGVPTAAHLIAGTRAAHACAAAVLVSLSVLLWWDPVQGLVAVANGTPAVFLCFGLIALVSRVRPTELQPAFAAAAVVSVLACLTLTHPAFHYPDVDTHARLLAAIREDPSIALDPRPFQARTGAWTRTIAGARVAFPYSPAFHIVAWPWALLFGNAGAVKLLAAMAVATSTLLVHRLARALGLGVGTALLAQVLFAALPVLSSRLYLALFPTLFAQALELGLLAALIARLPLAQPWSVVIIGAFMAATQLAYTGSVINVAAIAATLAVFLWTAGERGDALRVVVMAGVTTSVVGLAFYARFLPVMWNEVLPHAGSGGAEAGPGLFARTLGRLVHFFGPAYPVLALAGAWRAARSPGWRVLAAGGAAGLLLLALRGAMPTVFRDAKEVELLAGPTAVFSAAALARLAESRMGRVIAGALTAALVAWGLIRAVGAFTQFMLAVDR